MSIENKLKTILKLENGIEIKADQLNWTLYIPSPRTYWYYSSLSDLFTDLLNLKIKEIVGKSPQKTLPNLIKAIEKANKEIREIIDSVTTIKIPVQSCLDLQEGTSEVKDD